MAKFRKAKSLQKFASIVLPFSVAVANNVIFAGLVKMVSRDGEEKLP